MMKKIFLAWFLGITLWANPASYPATIYDNVILRDSKNALLSAQALEEALRTKKEIKAHFEALALNWKRVQTLYIAGELDDGAVDLPYEIDIYHHAKENIHEQLDRIILSSDAPQKAMFKNSYKTINALEYLLYKKSVNEDKELEMALIALKTVRKNLQTIVSIYESSRGALLENEKKFNALLINQLSASSYELKEWRVGEATGLSKKYKDNPDSKRAEFALSALSVPSLLAILDTHLSVMDAPYVDFGDKAIEYGAKADVTLIRTSLHAAIKNTQSLGASLLHVNAKKLYGDLGKLHNGYYVSLISSLRMTSKILDADGD